jgi:hypothetical protein
MNIGNCKTCKYKVDQECRRFPPQVSVVMVPVKNVLSQGQSFQPKPVCTFPMVEDDLYCGEFAVKMSLSA